MQIQPRPDWQCRVIQEKADLDMRIEKLRIFLELPPEVSPPLEETDLLLLQEQLQTMMELSSILSRRIERFTV